MTVEGRHRLGTLAPCVSSGGGPDSCQISQPNTWQLSPTLHPPLAARTLISCLSWCPRQEIFAAQFLAKQKVADDLAADRCAAEKGV